jgi:hypothetical protein
MFVFFLVGGSTLVRHTELRVERGNLYEADKLVGALASPSAVERLGATVASVAGTHQPSSLRFHATGDARFADRLKKAQGGIAVHVVLRTAAVVEEPDMRGIGGTNPPNKRLLARLPPDLAFAVTRKPLTSADDLARAVFASIPDLLTEPRRAAFRAAAQREEARVAAVCGWFQVGHAREAARVPDVLRRTVTEANSEARFGRLIGAMIDTDRKAGGAPSTTGDEPFSVDRAALLCLEGVPLSRLIATTLFGDGGCATSVAAWDASVIECAL